MNSVERNRAEGTADYETILDRSYHPGKADMEREISVPVSPERLAQAALKGGAPRRED